MTQTMEEPLVFDTREEFAPHRIIREATIIVQAALEEAFPLFTPAYESLWLPTFQPVFIDGAEPQYAGKIFFTMHKDESIPHPVVWVMTSYNPGAGTADYTRFTPASDVTVIRIRASDAGNNSTMVAVRYEITGLTERGNAFARSMDETAFAAWIGEWETAIEAYLERKRRGE